MNYSISRAKCPAFSMLLFFNGDFFNKRFLLDFKKTDKKQRLKRIKSPAL